MLGLRPFTPFTLTLSPSFTHKQTFSAGTQRALSYGTNSRSEVVGRV